MQIMCGIAGLFSWGTAADAVSQRELEAISGAVSHRGPDGSGLWMDPSGRVALAHRRLAIIDLSANANQPMSTADGRYRITFNGEIYNHKALRQDLMAKGVVFRSASDTEVILALYAQSGPNQSAEMLGRLRGMFAFAIWDQVARTLFLARDPYGIKPLYYHDGSGTLRFASEVRALLQCSAIPRRINPAAKASYFTFGHITEPDTIVDGIKCLGAGESLLFTEAGPGQPLRYASVENAWRSGAQAPVSSLSRQDRAKSIARSVVNSVEAHFVADVPVGVFLSAGVDSSMIVSAATAGGRAPPRTFTIGFDRHDDDMTDEVSESQDFARRYGTQHTTTIITAHDFDACYDHFLSAMDQPTIDGLNTYFVSRSVHDHGLKVALSGVGGDELMMAYSTFKDLPRLVHTMRAVSLVPGLGKALRRAAVHMLPASVSPKLPGLAEYGVDLASAYLLRRCLFAPWERPDITGLVTAHPTPHAFDALGQLRRATHGIDDAQMAVGALESTFYMRNQLLRDSDWTSMAHGIELRTPLVDWQLLQEVTPLLKGPNAPSRIDIARHMPTPIGEDVLMRKKAGFATPVRGWMIDKLAREHGRTVPVERGLRSWAKLLFQAYCDKHGLSDGP
jgi:asparagine synthase (glutamine-hydrolysing)